MTQLEYLNLNQGREQPGWLRNISTNKVTVTCVHKGHYATWDRPGSQHWTGVSEFQFCIYFGNNMQRQRRSDYYN